MKEISFEIPGQPVSKKTKQQIIPVGVNWNKPMTAKQMIKYMRLLPNKKYRKWKKGAQESIKGAMKKKGIEMIPRPVRVWMRCRIFRHGNRAADMINIINAVADEVQSAGLIENDTQIRRLDHSDIRFGVEKGSAGVLVKISWRPEDIHCAKNCSYIYTRRDGEKGCKKYKKKLEKVGRTNYRRLKICDQFFQLGIFNGLKIIDNALEGEENV